jgi:hypothetical protein
MNTRRRIVDPLRCLRLLKRACRPTHTCGQPRLVEERARISFAVAEAVRMPWILA